MAQASRTPAPGTVIQDADGPVLLSAAAIATGSGSWVSLGGRPQKVAFKLVTSAIAGGPGTLEVKIEGADDASGTNPVVLGVFEELTEADDSETKYLRLAGVFKPYARATQTEAGTDITGTITVTAELWSDRLALTDTVGP